ncbi:MAG: DNA primase [Spirochaetaceae bacterium]|nr:DNA primase [Spirochaetaceae bacterium]
MGRISSETRQAILEKTDFLAVYQEHVRLVRKGSSYWGLCPFHTEKTPSFSVNAETGLFYCFGCHKGGSIVQFLMEMEKLTYHETMIELARRAGVPLSFDDRKPEEIQNEEKDRRDLLDLHERLATTFNWFLTNTPHGRNALDVLHRRGIDDTLIEKFRLGYAPADRGWLHAFLRSKGYSDEFLAKSGLFSGNNPTWPLFADRIMFPIMDAKGRVVAFGGRCMSDDGPKYLNSPDTLLYRKQETLFALPQALESIANQDAALVCEGYMDALSFHQAGITHAVAPLGTAFTARQALMLRRRAARVLLCFDGDEAGVRAAERACVVATAAGLEVSVLMLEGGKDASEILEKQGPGVLTQILKNTINAGTFLLTRARKLFDVSTMEGKAKAISFLFPYLDALDSDVKRQDFFRDISMATGVSAHAIASDFAKAKLAGGLGDQVRRTASEQIAQTPGQGQSRVRTADLLFMTAVALQPEFFNTVRAHVGKYDLDDPRARDLFEALEEAEVEGVHDLAGILTHCTDSSTVESVAAIAASGELAGERDRLILDGTWRIRKRTLQRRKQALIDSLATAGGEADPAKIQETMETIMRIDAELKHSGGSLDE